MDRPAMPDAKPCRHCQQPVHPQANKCPHCHGLLATPSRLESTTKKAVGTLGVLTALLSLFYGLKEGYFYIEQRQQQREMLAAHMLAAENFVKLDNLDYAERAVQEALTITPDDKQLRLRAFQLRAQDILRELDYYGAQLPNDRLTIIPELISDGFSLMSAKFPRVQQAHLLGTLARLLQFDRQWQNPGAVDDLFTEALALIPDNPEIAYWYGERLITTAADRSKGLALIETAATLDPDNAIYIAALGRHHASDGHYAAAFAAFRRAIELHPQQHGLQAIRAANEAKRSLRQAIRSADEKADISAAHFYGLSLAQRRDIVDFALRQGYPDRYFKWVAAKLLFAVGEYAEAEALMRDVLGNYDERSNVDQLQLFAQILAAQNKDEALRLDQLLAEIARLASYEEILETGIKDQHRYKVGLRVRSAKNAKTRDADTTGVEVLKVFSGYPFAKAGVQTGDFLLEFAHRKVTSLRSIWVPINEFSPGTDVPLKLRRDGKVLDLIIVIE